MAPTNTAPYITIQKDWERRREDADIEASLRHTEPEATPAAPGSWRINPVTGVSSRETGTRGETEFVQNVGSTVKSWKTFTPQPVDTKKSYAELILTDLPKRIDLVSKQILEGNIPDAEAGKAEIEKFADDNRDYLYKLASYNGRDRLTAAAASRAFDLINGTWLTDNQKIMLSPKLNPKARDFWGTRTGATPELVATRKAADSGDPVALSLVSDIESMSGADPAALDIPGGQPRKTQAAAPGATAAPSVNPVELGGRYVKYYGDAASLLLAGAPEGTAGPAGISSAVKPLFKRGDQDVFGCAAARFTASVSNVSSTDDPGMARKKIEDASVKVGDVLDSWGDGDPVFRRMAIPAMESLRDMFKGGFTQRLDTAKAAVARTSAVVKDALGAGRPLSDDRVRSLAKVSASMVTMDDSGLTDSERALKTELSKAAQVTNDANLRISQNPLLPPTDQGTISEADAKGRVVTRTIGAFGDAAYPGLVSQKDAILRASRAAVADVAANGGSFKDALVKHSAAIGDEIVSRAPSATPEDGMAAGRIVARYVAENGGADLRTLYSDMYRKYGKKLTDQVQEEAKAQASNPQTAAPVFKAAEDTASKLERTKEAPYDLATYRFFKDVLDVTTGDFKPGDARWNQLVKFTRQNDTSLVDTVTGVGSAGFTKIISSPLSELVDSDDRAVLVKAAADAALESLNTLAPRRKSMADQDMLRASTEEYFSGIIDAILANPDAAEAAKRPDGQTVGQLLGSNKDLQSLITSSEVDEKEQSRIRSMGPYGVASNPLSSTPPARMYSRAPATLAQQKIIKAFSIPLLSAAGGGLTGRHGESAAIPVGLAGVGLGTASTSLGTALPTLVPSLTAEVMGTVAPGLTWELPIAHVPGLTVAPAAGALPGATVASAVSLGAGVAGLATLTGAALYNLGLEELQPAAKKGLGGSMRSFGAAFLGAPVVVPPSQQSEVDKAQETAKAQREDFANLEKVGFTSSGLPLEALSPEARKEFEAFTATRPAREAGLPSLPGEYYESATNVARAMNAIGEASNRSTMAVENAEVQRVLHSIKADPALGRYSGDVFNTVYNFVADNPDKASLVAVKSVLSRARQVAISAEESAKGKSQEALLRKKMEVTKELKEFEAQLKAKYGGDGLTAVTDEEIAAMAQRASAE